MTKNAIPTPFSETLKYLRVVHNLTQPFIADMAGFDKSFISRLESGHRKPSRDVILLLAESMNLSPDETDRLLLSAGFTPVQPKSLLSNPELARLDDLMASTSDEKKSTAQKTIQDLIGYLSISMRQTHAAAD